MGLELSDEKLTFPSLLTESLAENEMAIGSRDFIFYNGGIPGSLTRRWLSLYQESVALLDPNLVITVFFLRDGTRELGSIAGLSAIRESMQQYRERSFLFRNSRLYRLLIEQSKQREVGKTYFESISRAYLGSPGEIREWQAAQENLLSIRDDVLKRGGKFALVIFPILFGLTDDYPLQEVVDEIERFGISNNIPYLFPSARISGRGRQCAVGLTLGSTPQQNWPRDRSRGDRYIREAGTSRHSQRGAGSALDVRQNVPRDAAQHFVTGFECGQDHHLA